MTDWTTPPVSFPHPIAALKSFLRRAAARRHHKQALKSLRAADDHTLQDIGITREEVTRAIGHSISPTVDAELTFLYRIRPKR